MKAKFDISLAWEWHQIEKSRLFSKLQTFPLLTHKTHALNPENLFNSPIITKSVHSVTTPLVKLLLVHQHLVFTFCLQKKLWVCQNKQKMAADMKTPPWKVNKHDFAWTFALEMISTESNHKKHKKGFMAAFFCHFVIQMFSAAFFGISATLEDHQQVEIPFDSIQFQARKVSVQHHNWYFNNGSLPTFSVRSHSISLARC